MSEPDSTPVEVRLWVEVLDRLEAELIDAEMLLDGTDAMTGPAWRPGESMPELPESLVDRTHDLLERQGVVLARLEATRVATRGQLRYVSVDAARGLGAGPRFVDQRA